MRRSEALRKASDRRITTRLRMALLLISDWTWPLRKPTGG